jgi:hypothetical protein
MNVFVVVPTAVYSHGIIGVYETEEDALRAARQLWPTTDGHHTFVVHKRVVGATYVDFPATMYGMRDPGELRVEVEDEPPPVWEAT